MAKEPRCLINNEQRKALRSMHKENKLTQKELMAWFSSKFYKSISRSALAYSLSRRFIWLDSGTRGSKIIRDREPKWPMLDKVLFDWQLEQKSRGEPLSTDSLIAAARKIWGLLPNDQKIDAKTGELLPVPEFSCGWLNRFKNRYGISLRKQLIDDTPSRNDGDEQLNSIRSMMKDYPRGSIYTMDETGFYWKREISREASNGPTDKTIDKEDVMDEEEPREELNDETMDAEDPKKEPNVEKEAKVKKDRICITFCTNADGSDKLPIHFIIKPEDYKNSSNATRKENNSSFTWQRNQMAWMTTALMEEWLQIFYDHVDDKHVILLMDDFFAHKCAVLNIKPPANVKIVFLPSQNPSLYQPLEQGIIYNAKQQYLKHLLEEQLQFYKLIGEANVAEMRANQTIPRLSINESMCLFHKAWMEDVTPETIQSCFLKSALFTEKQATEFTPPSLSSELKSLYYEVIVAGGINGENDIQAFITPPGENIPPINNIPTFSEFVQCHVSVPQFKQPVKEIKAKAKKRSIEWNECCRMTHRLLDVMNYTDENSPEIRSTLRAMSLIFAKKAKEALESTLETKSPQTQIPSLANGKCPKVGSTNLFDSADSNIIFSSSSENDLTKVTNMASLSSTKESLLKQDSASNNRSPCIQQ